MGLAVLLAVGFYIGDAVVHNVQRIVKNDPLAAAKILRGGVVLLDAFRREKVIFIVGEKAL